MHDGVEVFKAIVTRYDAAHIEHPEAINHDDFLLKMLLDGGKSAEGGANGCPVGGDFVVVDAVIGFDAMPGCLVSCWALPGWLANCLFVLCHVGSRRRC